MSDHTALFEYKETVFYTLLGLNILDILLINCGYWVEPIYIEIICFTDPAHSLKITPIFGGKGGFSPLIFGF